MEAIEKLREMDRDNLIPYGNGDYRPDTRHGQIADEIEREIAKLQECWAQEAREHADDSAILAELAHENAELKREIERDYMRLPVDVEGTPIHVGDRVEVFATGKQMCVYLIGNEWIEDANGIKHSVYSIRHVEPDPLKEPLRELVDEYVRGADDYACSDVIAKCADKLRELMEADA